MSHENVGGKNKNECGWCATKNYCQSDKWFKDNGYDINNYEYESCFEGSSLTWGYAYK